ncbi:hypothetical protein C8R44DRAFT_870553 [Mycena epipterygia]|nr:hypothetical protein C8R44DRAFT_870553 [Mycena epipterygia]
MVRVEDPTEVSQVVMIQTAGEIRATILVEAGAAIPAVEEAILASQMGAIPMVEVAVQASQAAAILAVEVALLAEVAPALQMLPVSPAAVAARVNQEPQFDWRLKYDAVPTWNGNTDTIIKWVAKINDIARESPTVYRQLGRVVPKRLEEIEQNWDTLKQAFVTFYINRNWLDRQKYKANRAYYREQGHGRETPGDYYIRKVELLTMVYTLDDSTLIMEVMEGAPATWNTVLGVAKNPKSWLDRMDKFSKGQQMQINTHALLLKTLINENLEQHHNLSEPSSDSPNDIHACNPDGCVFCQSDVIRSESNISSKAQRNATDGDDPLAEEPLEGGPKTSEAPPEDIPREKLLSEVDFSPDLTEDQRQQLEEVVLKHHTAFGLDGRLGNFAAQVDITMKPNSDPVSLPPFHASPANREVIDKQMDSWISLGQASYGH